MATIEPRLIHLLNDATTPQLANADLPPLQATNLPQPNDDRPLPLEPDAGRPVDSSGRNVQSSTNTNPVLPPYQPDDGTTGIRGRTDARYGIADRLGPAAPVTNISSYPLRLLLSETSAPESSSNSLSRILSDGVDGLDDMPKKRHRGMTVKDDIVQLPQPVKKQKATQQQVMPPIINGLLEPPPDAALFPPISSSSFDHNDPTQPRLLREFATSSEDRSHVAQPGDSSLPGGAKTRRRAAKPRRKWSEAETKHLLLGVSKHGVGKWTSILEDPEFEFNERTAGDLKDRFRTCCPEELRVDMQKKSKGARPPSSVGESATATPIKTTTAPTSVPPKQKAKTGLLSENILIESEDESRSNTPTPQPLEPLEAAAEAAPASTSKTGKPPKSSKPKKSRAHRKKVEDLAELGILGPFKKSRRRERRPFADQDDQEILQGLDLYGPAWTKIQRDPRFNLSSRQPTDLRDRVRNKYPTIYSRIEKGAFQVKDPNRANDLLEPSVNMMMIENSLFPSTSAKSGGGSRSSHHFSTLGSSSRDDLLKWPSSFDTYEPAIASSSTAQASTTTGEMDISRFLVDNPSDSRSDGRLPLPGPLSRSVSPSNGMNPRRDRSPGRR